MLSCPYCQHEIPDDFGLLECSGCGKQVFVDMNGVVDPSKNSSPHPDEPKAEMPMVPPVEIEVDSPSLESEDLPADSGFAWKVDSDTSLPPVESESVDLEDEEQESSVDSNYQDLGPEGDDSSAGDWDEPSGLESDMNSLHSQASGVESGVLMDLASGAAPASAENLIESQVDSGILKYNLSLSGIDTADIREMLHGILSEVRLMLEVDSLFREIDAGVLVIESLPAVKAAYIVKELSSSSIEIEWTQVS